MIRINLINILIILFLIIAIPYLISISLSDSVEISTYSSSDRKVLFNKDGETLELSLDEYIIGVVAAEMPANFEIEAIKAQAVAARTYAIKQMGDENTVNVTSLKQSYIDQEEMEKIWGVSLYPEYYSKIKEAVLMTSEEVIVYQEKPIEAVFHSTSAGRTQASTDIWNTELPYLESVDSDFDIESPEYLTVKEFTSEEIINLIRNKDPDFMLYEGTILEATQIINRSESGYITSIQIGNKIFTGEEIREILDLNSSNFSIENNEGKIKFICKGYGHGVGLSQYGANFMAVDGATYKEIINHYYTNVEIVNIEEIE
ncbi:MAG: stage II sporulation protein D [Eubacteriales bacterium]